MPGTALLGTGTTVVGLILLGEGSTGLAPPPPINGTALLGTGTTVVGTILLGSTTGGSPPPPPTPTAASSDMQGAGQHLPSEAELLRRLKRRRLEEEALILYSLGEITLEQTNELVGA